MSVILCSVFLLSGCGGEQKRLDGYLNVAWNTNVMTLDNSVATDTYSLAVLANCTDGLLNADSSRKMVPGIAES